MTGRDIDDFRAFFAATHGTAPFPWQIALLERVLTEGWPDRIRVGTGLGKTSVLDVAIFHASRTDAAPARILYVVDRRTIVDAAATHAGAIAGLLAEAVGPGAPETSAAVRSVAHGLLERSPFERLRRASVGGDASGSAADAGAPISALDTGVPLTVISLRGGRDTTSDDGIAVRRRSLLQTLAPSVVVGTVDQIGSRLLLRGYGVPPRQHSVEAGLVGVGSLLLVDEPHLSVPFLDTVAAVRRAQGQALSAPAPTSRLVVLGATLPYAEERNIAVPGRTLGLSAADRQHSEIRKRRERSKPVVLHSASGSVAAYARLVSKAKDAGARRIGVFANTVGLARSIYEAIHELTHSDRALLVIGRNRPVERAVLDGRVRQLVRADGEPTAPDDGKGPVIVVSTQTLEVGADVSFDHLISEAAPWPNLVQRAGRLLRWGEDAATGWFEIVRSTTRHPAYGDATAVTFELLQSWEGEGSGVDFGQVHIDLAVADGRVPAGAFPPATRAPVLLPGHLENWVNTSPHRGPDYPAAPFLHGLDIADDDVRIVWRIGVTQAADELRGGSGGEASWSDEELGLDAFPLQSEETLEVPIGAARRFLLAGTSLGGERDDTVFDDFTQSAPEHRDQRHTFSDALVQARDGTWSKRARHLRPGATVLVDVTRGGIDEFGWAPLLPGPVTDQRPQPLADWQLGFASFSLRVIAEAFAVLVDGVSGRREDLLAAVRERWAQDTTQRERRALRQELGTWLTDTLREWADAIDLSDKGDDAAAAGGIEEREAAQSGLESAPDAEDGDQESAAARARKQAAALARKRARVWARETIGELRRRLAEAESVSLEAVGVVSGARHAGGVEGVAAPRDFALVVFDAARSRAGKTSRSGSLSLVQHAADTAVVADSLTPAVDKAVRAALIYAAAHHDDGKQRGQWQARARELLGLNVEDIKEPLAKTGVPGRLVVDSERNWRHEAFSAWIAQRMLAEGIEASEFDVDLAIHAEAVHHGWGLPFFPVVAGRPETEPSTDTVRRLDRLRRRYGVWGLAWLEALLRTADWTASSDAFLRARDAEVTLNGARALGRQLGLSLEPTLDDGGETQLSSGAAAPVSSATSAAVEHEVAWAGLTVGGLADVLAAQGAAALLERVEQLAEVRGDTVRVTVRDVRLRWAGGHPLFTFRTELLSEAQTAPDAVLFDAVCEALVLLDQELRLTGANTVTGGSTTLKPPEYRAVAETVAGAGSLVANDWLLGWHLEWLLSAKGTLALNPAAIWMLNPSQPVGAIADAAKLIEKARGGAASHRRQLATIARAVLYPEHFAAARRKDAKVFGLDPASISHRAKVGEERGYVPVLAALAFYGLAATHPLRAQRQALDVTVDRSAVSVLVKANSTPHSARALRALTQAARDITDFGSDTFEGRAIKSGSGRAVFYRRIEPSKLRLGSEDSSHDRS